MNKICILTSVHRPFDTRIFHKEAKSLTKVGYEIILIAKHDKQEIREDIKIIPLKKPKNRIERFIKTDYNLYNKALKQNADIYHFHDPELLPWMLLLKIKTNAKIIYDIHENIPGQIMSKKWLPYILRRFIAYLYTFFEKIIIRFFDQIVTAGDDIKIHNQKKITIKNYPFKPSKNNAPPSTIIPKNIQFTYLGGVSENRCIKQIIQAFAHVKKNASLTIIGPCKDQKYLKDLKKIAQEQKHNIQFLDQTPHPKAMKHLKLANVGFALFKPDPNNLTAVSRNNKLYEYMSMELAVIAPDFSSWKKFIAQNNCGICVDPTKPKEIARAIEYLINHPKEAKKMGQNGQKAVLKKYNWENESKKLLKIYEKISKKYPI